MHSLAVLPRPLCQISVVTHDCHGSPMLRLPSLSNSLATHVLTVLTGRAKVGVSGNRWAAAVACSRGDVGGGGASLQLGRWQCGCVARRVVTCQAAPVAAVGEGGRLHEHLMIVSDLDLTMVDHKEPSHSALLQFNSLWAAEYAHNSLLVYSTGRSPEKYTELRGQVPLLTPAIAILSVGTEIRYGPSLIPDHGWEKYLNDGWDRAVVVEEAKKFSTLQFQEDSEQRPHKVSFKVEKKDAQGIKSKLEGALKNRGLKVKLIYSGGIDLDVLPQGAGKGEALSYLLKKQRTEGWATSKTLVCGDSGNDIELFTVQGVNGVIVGNAMEELVHWYKTHGSKASVHHATRRCAGGIMEALGHFNLGAHVSPRERLGAVGFSPPVPTTSGGAVQREVVEGTIFVEKWLRGELDSADSTLHRLIEVTSQSANWVSPWGSEHSFLDSISFARLKHGAMKELVTWVDCMQQLSLGDGVFLVTWRLMLEATRGGVREGLFATALLRAKTGTPNAFEWVRLHTSFMKM